MDEVEYYKKRYELIVEELEHLTKITDEQLTIANKAVSDAHDHVERLIEHYEARIENYEVTVQNLMLKDEELNNLKVDLTTFFEQFDWGDEKMRAYIIKARHDSLISKLKPLLNKLRSYRYPKQTNDFADHIIIPDFERDVR